MTERVTGIFGMGVNRVEPEEIAKFYEILENPKSMRKFMARGDNDCGQYTCLQSAAQGEAPSVTQLAPSQSWSWLPVVS